MRSDATEAALGLLGLTGNIDFSRTTSTTSTIPLKRKTLTSASAALSTSAFFPPSTSSNNGVANNNDNEATNSSETIDCVCGFTYDDGFSVLCDFCRTWVHAACFDVVAGRVPEIFKCWKCDNRGGLDRLREKAVRVQRARQKDLTGEGDVDRDRDRGGRRRVSSPGVDRKRRVSVAAIDGGSTKRRRRLSMGGPHPHPHPQPHHTSAGEEEHVDVDAEPATNSYVHIDKDVVPHSHTRDKLRRLAQHWRGVTALECDETLPTSTAVATSPVCLTPEEIQSSSPQTTLQPLTTSSAAYFHSHVNPHVRPTSYAVRTTQPIPSSGFIAPYTSTITPSTVYLSDPLNSYAHLGMPKPFVHLMGPPLDVALDARLAGNGSRFVRNGCRPNAVLRPVLCKQAAAHSETTSSSGAPEEDTLTFGVFALRDLKAQEEVVLGWEWDDGSVIHHLPALIDTPHLFAPHRFEQFRHQMTSMLHTLSSTFATCACGAKAKDCALVRLAEFVDGQTPPTPSPSPPSLTVHPDERTAREVDLGPLVGVQRGFKTRERVPMSGGMSGVEMDVSGELWRDEVGKSKHSRWSDGDAYPEAGPSRLPNGMARSVSGSSSNSTSDRDWKGKGRAVDVETNESSEGKASSKGRRVTGTRIRQASTIKQSSSAESTTDAATRPVGEAQLPPKLRKKWIHQSSEVLKEANGVRAMDVDDANDSKVMPPPPPLTSLPSRSLPPFPPHTVTSPTSSFANLSLLSPLVHGPAPHFPGSFSKTAAFPRHLAFRENTQAPSEETSPNPVLAREEERSILGAPFVRREDVLQAAHVEETGSSPLRVDDEVCREEVGGDVTMDKDKDVVVEASKGVVDDPGTDKATEGDAKDTAVEEAMVEDEPARAASPSATAAMQVDPPSDVPSAAVASAFPEPPADAGKPPSSPPSPSAAPAPAPKVKLSLRDFAMRKKKRREEEQAGDGGMSEGKDTPHSTPSSVSNAVLPEVSEGPGGEDARAEAAPALVTDEPSVVEPTDERRDDPSVTTQRAAPSPPPHPTPSQSPPQTQTQDLPRPPRTRALSPPPLPTPSTKYFPSGATARGFHSYIHTRPPPSYPHAHPPLARQISQEDGEIVSPPAPAPKPLPLAPRAHTPPTHPRSFHPAAAASSSSSSSGVTLPGSSAGSSTSPARRPTVSTYRAPPAAARPLPSGPRALRGAAGSDRDREWDRERGRWGRSRGGSWVR